MQEAKEVLKSILRTSIHETTEDLQWTNLTEQEKRTCLANGLFDIDFCAFSGLTDEILNDVAVYGMLSNLCGTFVKSPYIQRLNGFKNPKVLVICDIKPFKLALTLNESFSEDDQNLVQEENEEEEEQHLQRSTFMKRVSDLLDCDKGRTFAFRDVKSKISSVFRGFELICFQFGQKQELDNFVTRVEKMGSKVRLNVAVGLEVFLDGYLLLTTPENLSIGECFFPMLLSKKAGSVLCSSKNAVKFSSKSKR
jgi:hypothetical protein